MNGGVTPFRRMNGAVRNLGDGSNQGWRVSAIDPWGAIAVLSVMDRRGDTAVERSLSSQEYVDWVDWIDPVTGEQMGIPRLPSKKARGSVRFAEIIVSSAPELSFAAERHPDLGAALEDAQWAAARAICRWLGQHSICRAEPKRDRRFLPVEGVQIVGIAHRTSPHGVPYWHIRLHIGARVWAKGAWRALDSKWLRKQQADIFALGTETIANHSELVEATRRYDLPRPAIS